MRTRYIFVLITALLLGSRIPLPQAADAAAAVSAPYRYFSETGHSISGASKQFYDANGGVAIFGLPLTEVTTEPQSGLAVQYFERARFELRSTGVGLTRLGTFLTANRHDAPFLPRSTASVSQTTLYAETGHTLSGAFAQFYRAHGGLPTFGYPISEPFTEVERSNNQSYTVQYFERARFMLPTDPANETTIQLGLVGAEYARFSELPPSVLARVTPLQQLGESTVAFSAHSASGKNMSLAAAHLDGVTVAPKATVSFNMTIGAVTTRAGYVIGQAVVNGQIQNDVGGGICMVSTALYQAALRAGLEIVSRRSHSVPLQVFADTPGMDAAVSLPDLDFKLRNDTAVPVIIYVASAGSKMSISLWGQGDGRTVTISKPVVSNQQAGTPLWRYDETLSPGTFQQVDAGSNGMDVVVTRKVRSASGHVLHQDTIRSHYAPLAATYIYGPGVDPIIALTPTAIPPTATPVLPTAIPMPATPTSFLADIVATATSATPTPSQ